MQSFPITTPAGQGVFAKVSPEGQRIPVLSDEQRQVQAAIAASQAAARVDPALNGQNARLPGRESPIFHWGRPL
jgi:hypothetical protein